MSPLDVPTIRIDAAKCRKDNLCVSLCPARIFVPQDKETPSLRHPEECVLCGHCVAGCVSDAIEHSGLDLARRRRITNRQPVTAEAALEFISQRRSVRMYKPEPPARELLEKAIQAAGFAPGSPHHRVGWVRHFTVVSGQEAMREVRELTVDYVRRLHKLLTSAMLRIVARFNDEAKGGLGVAPGLKMALDEWDAGRDCITYDAPAAVFAHAPSASSLPQVDCDAAMATLLLMAPALGLGACWNGLLQDAAAGRHLRGFDGLRKLLKIPEGHLCYAAATIGYPAVKLHSVPQRDVAIDWIG